MGNFIFLSPYILIGFLFFFILRLSISRYRAKTDNHKKAILTDIASHFLSLLFWIFAFSAVQDIFTKITSETSKNTITSDVNITVPELTPTNTPPFIEPTTVIPTEILDSATPTITDILIKKTYLNALTPSQVISVSEHNAYSIYGDNGIKYKVSLQSSDYSDTKAEYKIIYKLKKEYTHFRSILFFQTGRYNSAIFSYSPIKIDIWGNDELIYSTGLDNQSGQIEIDLPVSEIDEFKVHLSTDFEQLRIGGGRSFDEIIFSDAYFE